MRRFDTFPEPDLCNLIDFADEVVLATQAGPPRLKNRSRLSSEEAVPLITFHTPFRSIIRIKGDHPMDTFFELAIDVLPDEKSAQQLFLGFNPIEPKVSCSFSIGNMRAATAWPWGRRAWNHLKG